MTPKAARGFLMLSLSNEQRERVMRRELELPEGRYLLPCEISKFFSLTTGQKTEQEILAMESLEKDFDKILWKQRKLEDLKERDPISATQELHQFDEYVVNHWNFSLGVQKMEVY